jgi:carboxymethylenebutenolidase
MTTDGSAIGRRTFIAASIAGGFALAVQPIAAETIITDAQGLTAGMVEIAAADRAIPGYRARPAASAHAPVVLVVQEIFGLHEHIKDICRRLAKLGYYAIAPDLFARFGDATKMPDGAAIMRDIVSKVPDAQVLGDLDACVGFAKGEGAATDRLAITGFCWGGRIVWLYAAHNADLKAAVAWYGPLIPPTNALHPKNPIDVAADLKAPVLGLYGGADQNIPVPAVRALEAAIKAAGKTADFVVYPDTPHAFNADYRPSYREGPAKDGWQRMQAWFRANGV